MRKYEYKYCVYKNNVCDGILFVRSYKSLREALNDKERIQSSGGGCCDVVKKKFVIGASEPTTRHIYDNYKYSEYDLKY